MTIMKTRISYPPGLDAAPGEAGAWFEKWTLLSLTLDAVQGVEWSESDYKLAANSGYTFRPVVMLAILTYCYASRVYRPREIELRVSQDDALRCLCAGRVPPGHELRDFRRSHRELLRRAVRATWRLARRYRILNTLVFPGKGRIGRPAPTPGRPEFNSEPGPAMAGPARDHQPLFPELASSDT